MTHLKAIAAMSLNRVTGAANKIPWRLPVNRTTIVLTMPEGQARLKMRKENAGMANRDDVQSLVDFIDADEKRL